MVPDGWFGGVQNALSHVMVEDYIAKYGGTSADINADVAEAYSAGEVLADAVKATKSVNNTKIITYLHSGVTLQTVQGPVKFQSRRREPRGRQAFIFQWQTTASSSRCWGPTRGPQIQKRRSRPGRPAELTGSPNCAARLHHHQLAR